MALRRWGNSPLEGDTTLLAPLTILPVGSPPGQLFVDQFSTNDFYQLQAVGGAPPYTWSLVSQTSINPATWQINPATGLFSNLAPTILNVEIVTIVAQVTDTIFRPVPPTITFTVQVNRKVPAGAAALGYNTWLFGSIPNANSNIYFGAYGNVPGLLWSSGWPFSGFIPQQAALYSETPTGALIMKQLGSTSAGPNANTAFISAVQLFSSAANAPVAAGPLIVASAGAYVSAKLRIVNADPNIRPAVFTFPTQHNVNAPFQDADPNDGNNRRWAEKDNWEGSASNGKSGTWNGDASWAYTGTTGFQNPNQTLFTKDSTVEHDYGMAYVPSTGTLNLWRDNVANGSTQFQSTAGVPLTAEQLAWINATTEYIMIGALNDGTTPYSMEVYEVDIYVGNLVTPTFSPPGGSYSSSQTVTINGFGAQVYYTTDGSTPTFPVTGTTQHYTAPITVSTSETVKAIAVSPSYPNSTVGSASYTISSGGAVPTNVQVILQGQNQPVATFNGGQGPFTNCVVQSKGGTTAVEPNWNYLGWQSVSGATSYKIYRSKNGGPYSFYDTITDANAQTNYTNYSAMYPTQTQTYGTYLSGPGTQCSPATGINRSYYDTAATGIIGTVNGFVGASGSPFGAVGNISLGSTVCNITSVTSGTVSVGQGIGTPLTVTGLQIGTLISSFGTFNGTSGTVNLSQPALANQSGVVLGSVLSGNTGYTYYVTAVTGAGESGASAYAYIPFITNGGLVMCNGTFNSCMGTQQAAPATTPLGYNTAACWFPIQPSGGAVPGSSCGAGNYPSYLNAFSGNSAANYNLNTCGYNYINIALCPSVPGIANGAPVGWGFGGQAADPEICGDVGLLVQSGSFLSAYGTSSGASANNWLNNTWNTYKIPFNVLTVDTVTNVLQNAMYKITWGPGAPAGGVYVANTVIYVEDYYSVN